MKKALLFGASGFVGSYLLEELLNNPDYDRVTIVVRNPILKQHPKLIMLTGDYASLSQLKDGIEADDVFITLGTTKEKTPDKELYYQIDHDYPVSGAKIAKEKGASSVFMITAVGANPDSKIFYIKTKGEAERDLIALNYQHTHIFRPSMIMGNRKEKRSLERIFIKLFKLLNPLFIGRWNRYKGMDGRAIAKAMNNAAKIPAPKVKIYHWKEMQALQ